MGLFDLFKKKQQAPPRITPLEPDHPYGVYPKDWPFKLKLAQAFQHYQTMQDGVEFIAKTVYPSTFFSRYESALREARIVIDLCPAHETGRSARHILNILISEKTQIFNDFLSRCDDAGKLPFVKDEINTHRSEMPSESYAFFLELLDHHYDFNDRTEYIFCSVSFNNSEKTYYYLTADADIRCGDRVIVPVGKYNRREIGRVVKIEVFRGKDAPLPVDSLKYIMEVKK